MSSMGARVARMFRNFNVENRAHRVISKEKPEIAPRHRVNIASPPSTEATETTSAIHERNDPLLSLLKSVYVESTDPTTEVSQQQIEEKDEERRPLKFILPQGPYSMLDITEVPKGKLSIVEALSLLQNHKRSPRTWSPDKIAQEYSLDPKDSKALIDFFQPFEVKIAPPKQKEYVTKQIEDDK